MFACSEIKIAENFIDCKKAVYKVNSGTGFVKFPGSETILSFSGYPLKYVDHLTLENDNVVGGCILNPDFVSKAEDLVPAIIMPGSEYCLGTLGKLMANRILIFSSEQDFINYKNRLEHMCLIVEKDCKIEIAKKDIPVFKLTNKAEAPDTWTAPLIRTEHKFNEVLVACEHLQTVNKDWAGPKGGLAVEQGFHAYRKDSPNVILNPAIIPEGAEYCLGIDGEIVSNKLIVFSNEEEAKKYVSNSKAGV